MTRITVTVDGVAYEDDVEPRLLLALTVCDEEPADYLGEHRFNVRLKRPSRPPLTCPSDFAPLLQAPYGRRPPAPRRLDASSRSLRKVPACDV